MNTREVFERRLRQAVRASAREVQEEAQRTHRFTSKTGDLEKAIDTRMIANTVAEVYIDTNVAPHGPFVHNGTKAHIIKPKRKRALRWVPKGGNAFAFAKVVRHPGTQADPFLYDALSASEDSIRDIFARATNAAMDDIISDLSESSIQLNIKL